MPKDCIDWPASRDKDGYGFVKIGGKQMRAHRVALEVKIGRKLKSEEMSLHSCDNPPCVNPDHLFIGDTKTNNALARGKRKTLADMLLNGWEKIYGYG